MTLQLCVNIFALVIIVLLHSPSTCGSVWGDVNSEPSRTRRMPDQRDMMGLRPSTLPNERVHATAVYDVRHYGALGDGVTNDTISILAAVAACRSGGIGGDILFSGPGVYISSALDVSCSNSRVIIASDAVLRAVNTTYMWPLGPDCPEPSQGMTSAQAAPFILLRNVTNVTLTGGGTIDMRGRNFWDEHCGNWWCPPWASARFKKAVMQPLTEDNMATTEDSIATYRLSGSSATTKATTTSARSTQAVATHFHDWGDVADSGNSGGKEAAIPLGSNVNIRLERQRQPYAWRPFMLRIANSVGVRVENVSFVDPAFWCIVPTHSADIVVAHTQISADPSSPNTDGVEPMWSNNVHLHDLNISNGDDCITVKSGSHNVVAEDVECHHSHGITIGSVWYDDVYNVTYRRISMHNSATGPRIKGRRQGNATVRDILFTNITLSGVGTGIAVDMDYETPGTTYNNSGVTAYNISYNSIEGQSSHQAGSFTCLRQRPCSLFDLHHVRIQGQGRSGGDSRSKSTNSIWSCKYLSIASALDVRPMLKHSSCEPVHT